MEKPKLLFVCSQNKWRSLTAETLYRGDDRYVVKSAGTEQGARIRVTEGLLGWSDLIFVMEKRHREILQRKFSETLANKRLICLHISDDYGYMNAELIDILKAKLSNYIELPESNNHTI